MSEELPLQVLANLPAEMVQEPTAMEAPLPPQPTPEEAHAIDAAFALQQENQLVAGLLGLWTGALVMHDVAKETFSATEEEKKAKKRKQDKKEPPR